MLHLYKPPPPYPSNRISSNSTPDLAGISSQLKPHSHVMNNLVSGSSPDLVNQHYYYAAAQPVHRSQSYLPPQQQHGTYENLSSIFGAARRPQAAVIVENPNITKHIKKVYDEHGNIIYCMPANMKQILQENQLPSTGFVVTRNQNAVVAHDSQLENSTEPIYENIPFPWQNETRARTQSIHSAPEAINQNLQINNLQENLYANIEQNTNSPTLLLNSTANETNQSMSRTNTFIVNENSNNSGGGGGGETLTDVSTSTNGSGSSSGSKVKKRRWGILIGRGGGNKSSGEKVKSATLGREKEKGKEKNHQPGSNKHRWSTGLPRLHPLPPSISKETMVSDFGFFFVCL